MRPLPIKPPSESLHSEKGSRNIIDNSWPVYITTRQFEDFSVRKGAGSYKIWKKHLMLVTAILCTVYLESTETSMTEKCCHVTKSKNQPL